MSIILQVGIFLSEILIPFETLARESGISVFEPWFDPRTQRVPGLFRRSKEQSSPNEILYGDFTSYKKEGVKKIPFSSVILMRDDLSLRLEK